MAAIKKSSARSLINLRWIVFGLSLCLIVLAFFSIGSIRKQVTFEKHNAESFARMQEQVVSLAETNALMTVELEKLIKTSRIGDSIVTMEVWQRKIDSLERMSYYNSIMNRMVILNDSTLTKAREENQKLYDDYLTHINSILVFFSVLIALVTIVVPLMINRKTEDVFREHEKRMKKFEIKQNQLITQINKKAEEARQSATQTEVSTSNAEVASFNNIGAVNESKGNYSKALEYYNKALEIIMTKGDKDNPDIAMTFNNIAGVYESMHEYDKALEYYEKALEIRETKLGKNHPDTASVYNNIAITYQDKGDYNKALDNFEKALKIWLQIDALHPTSKAIFMNFQYCFEEANNKEIPFDKWLKGQLDEKEWEALIKLLESMKDDDRKREG